MPTLVPITIETTVAVKPTSSEMREPHSSMPSTSRPSGSVPSRWAPVGGSFGVALFGAIFASRLTSELTSLPANVIAKLGDVGAIDPARAKLLPPEVHAAFLEIFATALHSVFLFGMAIAIVPAVLAWFLKEVPLRTTLGRSAPPVEESLPEVAVEPEIRAAASR